MVSQFTSVSMIGLGKLGLECAEVMASLYNVTGYDIYPKTSSKITISDTLEGAVAGKDIIFVAVQTPHDPIYDGSQPITHLPNKDFDYTIVNKVLADINQYVQPHQLVVLISTVLPGTTRRELRKHITNARFIYNPYLIAMGTVTWDMLNPEMVIIGTEDGSETGDAKELIEFYRPLMQNDPRYAVGTWDEAEAIKIFYNTVISTKIGLVNMIQDVAMKSGNINVDVVTDALSNSNIRIISKKYMTAGMGDAGPCVLPNFPLIVDDEYITISELFSKFDKNKTFLIDSSNYACSRRDKKKISEVTCRDYDGEIIKITTVSGKVLETTANHLVPVERNRKRIIIRADEIEETDKLFGL